MQIVCGTPRVTSEEVRTSQLFTNWADRVNGWDIPRVVVADAFSWSGAIRMLQLRVTYNGRDHAVMLRGSSVDMLAILVGGDHTYVVHVDQPRVAVGQIVRSNAAGMIDTNEDVMIAGLRELGEELEVEVAWDKPMNLNQIVYGRDVPELGSPGGSDEDVTYFAVEARVTPADLAILEGHVAGLAHEGERTVVRLTRLFNNLAASVLPRLVVDAGVPTKKQLIRC